MPLQSAPTAVPTAQPSSQGNAARTAIIGKIATLVSRRYLTLTGVVIQIDTPQSMPATFRLGPFLIKTGIVLGIAALFGAIALTVVAIGFLLSFLVSFVFGSRSHSSHQGFFKSVLTQVTGFFLTSRLLTPKQLVPVNHIRIRDSAGVEHLIRIEGYMLTGRPSVGDDISVEGTDRAGTLDMHRGWNNRIRSEIRIKRR